MNTNGKERERRRDRLTVWEWHVHTAIFKIDNQYGPTVKKKKELIKKIRLSSISKKKKKFIVFLALKSDWSNIYICI